MIGIAPAIRYLRHTELLTFRRSITPFHSTIEQKDRAPARTSSHRPISLSMNADQTRLVHQRTSEQPWVPSSKAGTVVRRRVFRYGGEESGRVSSVVGYIAGAKFPSHPHPQGEEILVLDGIFSDWRGHHKAGTFLLNPEGFEHAPHSEQGCKLFVRLRQFPGKDRPQKAIDTNKMSWDEDGRKVLMDDTFDDRQYLYKVDRHQEEERTINLPEHGVEVFVVNGQVKATVMQDEKQTVSLETHDWIRIPQQKDPSSVRFSTADDHDAVLLIKENTLRSAFAPLLSS